jgi:hypothetical protein
MTKYGKIYIEANSIEEAEKELATIKALANAGAVYGKGSTDKGIEIRMGNVPSVPSSTCHCPNCSMCGCDCYEEDEEIDEIIDTIGRLVNDYCEGGVNGYEFLSSIHSMIIG